MQSNSIYLHAKVHEVKAVDKEASVSHPVDVMGDLWSGKLHWTRDSKVISVTNDQNTNIAP
jgi:hypothetical protein